MGQKNLLYAVGKGGGMMTIEKAKIIIGNLPTDDCYLLNEYQEAKAMAIKALEQEPCEDAINRASAINAVSEALEHVFVENENVFINEKFSLEGSN